MDVELEITMSRGPFYRDVSAGFLGCRVVTRVTRSSRRYCNTGATLGRGGVQAHQSQGRGLNNLLNHL